MARDIQRVGIIGKGKMGANIFDYLTNCGLSLVWVCKKAEDAELLEKKFQKKLEKMERRGLLSSCQYSERNKNIRISGHLDDLRDCDLVIECITEELDKKKTLFQALNSFSKHDCIFTSNTSSISLKQIFQNCDRKHRCAGLHFFYPLQYKNIIEINTIGGSDSETIAALKSFANRIDKQYLVLPEPGNFALNKVFLNLQAQAFRLYTETILSMKEIDELIKRHLFPIGAFEFMDAVGVSIMLTATKNYTAPSPDKAFYQPWINKMKQLVASGEDFYSSRDKVTAGGNTSVTEAARQACQKEALAKLTGLYLNAAHEVVVQEYCTESEIDHALREYMGAEMGPMRIAAEMGYANLHALLLSQYHQTGEAAYFPSAAITHKLE